MGRQRVEFFHLKNPAAPAVKHAGPGFASSDLPVLVRSGLATVTAQRVKAGGEVMCSPCCGSLTRGRKAPALYDH